MAPHEHAHGAADRSRQVIQEVLSLRVGDLIQGLLSGDAIVLSDASQDALAGSSVSDSKESGVLLRSSHGYQSGGGLGPPYPIILAH